MKKHPSTVLATTLLALACNGTTAPSETTSPPWSYVGEWAGTAQGTGSQFVHVNLRIDVANADSVAGEFSDGVNLSPTHPRPCGSAWVGAPFSQGQLYADSLVYMVPCAPGTGCTFLRFRAQRSGDGLSLGVPEGEVALTRC